MGRPKEKPDRDWDSSLEQKVGEMLDDIAGWAAWEHKYTIAGWEVDMYLHDPALVIECDGDYWHAHPRYWGDLDHRQQEQFVRDAKKEHEIETERGFRYIRIWEEHINEEPKRVRRRLADVLVNGNLPEGRYLIDPSTEEV